MRTSIELNRQAVLEGIVPRGLRTPENASVGDPRGKAAGNDATFEDPVNAPDDVEAWAQRSFAANGFGDGATAGLSRAARKPSAYEVHLAARALRSRALGAMIIAAFRKAGAFLRRALARYRQGRQTSALHDALREFDDRTLRDLGFHRSEIMTVVANSAREAERTRARVWPASYEFFLWTDAGD